MTPRSSEDRRSTAALFAATLRGDYDGKAPWKAVEALRRRGTMEVFELAAEYCRSPDPKARARGLDVMAQLGKGKPGAGRPYLGQCVEAAISLLQDPEPKVVHSAAWALAYLETEEGVAALLRIQRHPDPDIRRAVAVGIAGSSSPDSVAALLDLMSDPDAIVRDWATFGLGSQLTEDSPQIRVVLHEQLKDPYEPARSEALWGLALRKDRTGLRLLLERLESEERQEGDEYAAQEILDLPDDAGLERLCDGLRKLLG
jgi:HEAT repeat protein